MEATKTTSFIAGVLLVLSEAVIEFYSLPGGVFAFTFFSLIFLLVIGKQIIGEYQRQLRTEYDFDKKPWYEPDTLRFAVNILIRMLFFILGFISAAESMKLVIGI
ncbi:hypothetical protein ACFOEW_14895 [Alteromonas oceani]|uniref:Uncharacterized protein n=1 Tax=Alteromonas oceani TaxID=2071609 RepID=A0ABV7K193_9ALTE|nr:hypothetical protein [Alteromonas oceani]